MNYIWIPLYESYYQNAFNDSMLLQWFIPIVFRANIQMKQSCSRWCILKCGQNNGRRDIRFDFIRKCFNNGHQIVETNNEETSELINLSRNWIRKWFESLLVESSEVKMNNQNGIAINEQKQQQKVGAQSLAYMNWYKVRTNHMHLIGRYKIWIDNFARAHAVAPNS